MISFAALSGGNIRGGRATGGEWKMDVAKKGGRG